MHFHPQCGVESACIPPLNAVLLGKRRGESDVPSVLCNEDICLNPTSRMRHSSWLHVSSLLFSRPHVEFNPFTTATGACCKNSPFSSMVRLRENGPFHVSENGLFSQNGLFLGPFRNGPFFTTGPRSPQLVSQIQSNPIFRRLGHCTDRIVGTSECGLNASRTCSIESRKMSMISSAGHICRFFSPPLESRMSFFFS